MALVLFDPANRNSLFPLTHTRAVADLRIGILCIKERWQYWSAEEVLVATDAYLQQLYPAIPQARHLWVDATVLPDEALRNKIAALAENEALEDDHGIVAIRSEAHPANAVVEKSELVQGIQRLRYPWEIFLWNDEWLRYDFTLITEGLTSESISHTNNVLRPDMIFIEEGAEIEFATLNASTGPIFIGKDTIIMEGACIRGPFAAGEKNVIKMGAKIYGATSTGPRCTLGGEIKNVVMQGYSNKAHDGYLGDSVVGTWCNFGAGSSNSNVKNTGGEIKIWHEASDKLLPVGIKCGLVMGDYSRTAINTAINTATVIGSCCNVFGEGLTPKLIPSFTWGGRGLTRYEFDKALRDVDNWKKMKSQSLSVEETGILKHIFEHLK